MRLPILRKCTYYRDIAVVSMALTILIKTSHMVTVNKEPNEINVILALSINNSKTVCEQKIQIILENHGFCKSPTIKVSIKELD